MRATPSRTQISRFSTSGRPAAFSLPNSGMAGPGSDAPPAPPITAAGAGSGESAPEHSRGPELSEQLDMLADLFAARRQADLERRGLFLHPEVF
ncbi:MAG TPA: hypothetical protein VMF65_22350 [Acidimicrobiales bacterium]|nr:hypothetical protein [Acidimicrobiales bacterium]